jgi:hypothetical protein
MWLCHRTLGYDKADLDLTLIDKRGASKEVAAGLQLPQTPPQQKFKNTGFVDIMISKVLFDFSFRRNQPLKSADD